MPGRTHSYYAKHLSPEETDCYRSIMTISAVSCGVMNVLVVHNMDSLLADGLAIYYL